MLPDESELCRRLLPVVRLSARRRGLPAAEVDDVAQEVLVHVLVALRRERIDEPARLGAFAAGVCRNVLANRARVRARRDDAWMTFAPTVDAAVEADGREAAMDRLRLEDCLGELGVRAREVVRRTWYEGQQSPDIARDLGTSEGNVRLLRHRALEVLRDCMLGGAP